MLRLLHVSDLHFAEERRADRAFESLRDDLSIELGIDRLDLLVISGDSADKAETAEYEIAQRFVGLVCDRFHVPRERVLIVPGNHDVHWPTAKELYEHHYCEEPPKNVPSHPDRRGNRDVIWWISDLTRYRERFANFAAYHRESTGRPYSMDYHDQYDMVVSADRDVVLLGLNSAWRLDEDHEEDSELEMDAVARGLTHVAREAPDASWKIAVWHHPPDGQPGDAPLTEPDAALDRLALHGFTVGLHGHVHRAKMRERPFELSPTGKKLTVLGAGTLDGPAAANGYPWQYSILTIDGTKTVARSRGRGDREGAWHGDHCYRVPGAMSDTFTIHRPGVQDPEPPAPARAPVSSALVPQAGAPAVETEYGQWLRRQTKDFLAAERFLEIGPDALITSRAETWRLFVPLRLVRLKAERSLAPDQADDLVADAPADGFTPRRAAVMTAGETAGIAAGSWRRDGDPDRARERESLSEALGSRPRRLVVLGKAGAGKTTLIAWATAGLLSRSAGQEGDEKVPDLTSLPEGDLLPVRVLCDGLTEFPPRLDDLLEHVVAQTSVASHHRSPLAVRLRDRLCAGTAALLIDGLDALVGGPAAWEAACRAIESCIGICHEAPVVVTCREASYRELDEPLTGGFARLTVAGWSREEKKRFALEWAALTTESDDRVGRQDIRDSLVGVLDDPTLRQLASTPLFFVMMASVVSRARGGALPRKRVRLYAKVVEELLTRQTAGSVRLDLDEAMPQLHYVAYSMCERDLEGLDRETMLEVLADGRRDLGERLATTGWYPPDEFLKRLTSHSDLLVVDGERDAFGEMVAVYRFQHPTFREFLAGCAIAQRHVPKAGDDLADHIAQVVERVIQGPSRRAREVRSGNTWVETIRIAAACSGNRKQDVLNAILSFGDDDRLTV